jgi:hypothetical protein
MVISGFLVMHRGAKPAALRFRQGLPFDQSLKIIRHRLRRAADRAARRAGYKSGSFGRLHLHDKPLLGSGDFSIDGGATPTMTFYGLGADSNFGGALATLVGTVASE